MTEINEPDGAQPTGISRRTVAKTMAWAVPAIAIAAPAPAFAASGGAPSGQFLDACKQPGNSCFSGYGFRKGYTFTFTITNTTTDPLYIYPTLNGTVNPRFFLTVTSSTGGKVFPYATARRYTGGVIGAPLAAAELIAPGGSITIIINSNASGNSENISASGALYMAWGHTATPGSDPDHPYSPAPTSALSTPTEGWIRVPISFSETPPCGTDCGPGGDTTETAGG
ncbi:hypothetical protein LG315_10875 [Microbacterium marinum]|uniref:hypothetical protein n=1 Tax=Microbacterium marinum TaxID=421115 RepID=UPI00384A99BE